MREVAKINLSNIFWRDEAEDAAANRAQRDQAQHELAVVNASLDMFNVPLWGYIKDTLEETERSATDALVSGVDDPVGVRERIKLARHLAGMEDTFLTERARLLDVLKEEETE